MGCGLEWPVEVWNREDAKLGVESSGRGTASRRRSQRPTLWSAAAEHRTEVRDEKGIDIFIYYKIRVQKTKLTYVHNTSSFYFCIDVHNTKYMDI